MGNMRRPFGAEVRLCLPWKGNGTTHNSASASSGGSFCGETRLLLLLLLLLFEAALHTLNKFRSQLSSFLSSDIFPMVSR